MKRVIYLTIISTLFISVQCQKPTPDLRPNILLILTDDMGYGDVELEGNPYLRTPFLSQLASESIQFKHFYVSPVCAPTRASLLTGRYHQRTGVRSVTNGYEILDPQELTLAEVLQNNDYRTGLFGKWHLGEYYPSVPNAQGFEEFLGFRTGHTANYFDAMLEKNGRPLQTQGYITDVLTQNALDFMTNKAKEAPFFCYLAYNAPHTPLQVGSNWIEPYLAMGLDERTARIYGMIENLDHHIGQIYQVLEQQQLLENTLVIFMSDNGPISGWRIQQEKMRYNAGLRDQKFTVYEGGIRTQCYWMWKGHWPPNIESRTIGAHIDVLPTLLDILNIKMPGNHQLDGISLLPLLIGQGMRPDDRVFYQKYALSSLQNPGPFPGGIACRDPWKMVDDTTLYNLKEDPGETNNLAAQYPEILTELVEGYQQWYEDIVAERNLENVPISVGYPQENPVFLQPHHATVAGNLKFTGHRGLLGERIGTHPRGVDGDWLSNWKQKGDQVSWNFHVAETGTYQIGVQMRDSFPMEPISLQLLSKDTMIEELILPAARLMEWTEKTLAELPFVKGSQSVTLSLANDLEKSSFELRSLVLSMQPRK